MLLLDCWDWLTVVYRAVAKKRVSGLRMASVANLGLVFFVEFLVVQV